MKNIYFVLFCFMYISTFAQQNPSQKNAAIAKADSIKLQQKIKDSIRIANRLNKYTPEEKKLTLVGAELPNFKIKLYDSTFFYTNKIPKNKSVVVMLFNPTCEHCILETIKILEHQKKSFPNTVFVLATSFVMKDYLKDFIAKTDYKKQDNMVIGLDEDMATTPLFLYKGLPQIIVYNKNKKLEEILYQDVPTEQIENILRRPIISDNEGLPNIVHQAKQKSKKSKK